MCCVGAHGFSFVLVYFAQLFSVLALWQSTKVSLCYSQVRFLVLADYVHNLPSRNTPIAYRFEYHQKEKHLLITDLTYTSSLRNTDTLLANQCSIRRSADGQLGFLLHAITGLLRPNLTHYYGFICHLTPT